MNKREEQGHPLSRLFEWMNFRGHPDFTPISLKGAVEAITGYTEGDFLAGTPRWEEIIHPDDCSALEACIATLRSSANHSTQHHWRVINRDGQVRWVNGFLQKVSDPDGKPAFIEGVIIDITPHRQAEEALRESLQTLQSVLDALPMGVFWKDSGSVYRGCNLAYALAAGLRSPVGIIGKKADDLVWAGEEERRGAEDREVIEDGCRKIGFEGLQAASDERPIWVRRSKVPLLDAQGRVNGLVGTHEDITEHKEAQEEIYRTDKMQALRILAGGMAHDFNNLLTVMLGGLSLALNDPKLPEKTSKILKEAEKACQCAMRLTHQLIKTSSGENPVGKTESIREILDAAVQWGLTGSDVPCHVVVDEDLWPVNCDAKQVQRALANVILNAKEAIHNGGFIEITANNVYLEEGQMPLLIGGNYVRILVTDTGIGIPANHFPRLFDPYFSTKRRGSDKGMGLGLSTTYSILKRHGGHILMESKVSVGTTVHMYFPAS